MINNNSIDKTLDGETEPSSPALIDLNQLILIIGDDQAQLKDLLTMFYQDYFLKSVQIKEALQNHELATAQQLAHNIAGSAQMIGAESLLFASQAFDSSLKQGLYEPALSERFYLSLEHTLFALNTQIEAI